MGLHERLIEIQKGLERDLNGDDSDQAVTFALESLLRALIEETSTKDS